MKAWLLSCAAVVGLSAPALGQQTTTAPFQLGQQRANENIVASAEDAFGTRVGSENIGLYSPTNARGFNPTVAGNVRIEGLYFDQQAFLGRAIARSTNMRIGLSAQSYPFAAPTGIADTSLFAPYGDSALLSLAAELRQPVGLNVLSADYRFPITDTLSMGIGTAEFVSPQNGGVANKSWQINSIVGFKPNDNFEVIPFGFFQRGVDAEVAPSVFTAGAYQPPRTDRKKFYGQFWADRSTDDFTTGVVVRGNPIENWRLMGGIFRSVVTRPKNFVVFFRNVQPTGLGDVDVQRSPEHSSGSTSGEVRAQGIYTTGQFRHTVYFAVRGRDTKRLFGGNVTRRLGQATIGAYQEFAEPAGWPLGVRDLDHVRQFTPGASYVVQWAGVGEASVGLQRSYFRRDLGKENGIPIRTKSTPWLYNGTLAYNVTTAFALYASYTRGIEEFGTAPDNAANPGQPMPAQVTEQIDGGLRYTIMPGLTLNTGVFEIKKPYFDRDPANIFTVVGNLRHRGVEVSLTGRPITGLTVVAGAVYLKAQVSGLPVDTGFIGPIAPGTNPLTMRVNLQYGPPSWRGFAIEGQAEHESSTWANRLNTFKVGSLTAFSAGARYAFKVGETNANVRLVVQNIANTFRWRVDGNSGRFFESTPRVVQFRLAADF
jgi:iron complex outermembrane receptor protein